MPAHGRFGALNGSHAITSSDGFTPRSATIYMPPAALVKDPPPLPVVVFMMGLPGWPSPHPMVDVMNEFAAKNHGLAPIVVIADQLGSQTQNPGCVDSAKYGGVETYFNKDIPDYIRTPSAGAAGLEVLDHRRLLERRRVRVHVGRPPSRTSGGTSPRRSGEPWAGIRRSGARCSSPVYNGDLAAFDANKPAGDPQGAPRRVQPATSRSSPRARWTTNTARPNRTSSQLAEAAGFRTTFYLVPNATHTGPGLRGGLEKAFSILFPRWGLAAG